MWKFLKYNTQHNPWSYWMLYEKLTKPTLYWATIVNMAGMYPYITCLIFCSHYEVVWEECYLKQTRLLDLEQLDFQKLFDKGKIPLEDHKAQLNISTFLSEFAKRICKYKHFFSWIKCVVHLKNLLHMHLNREIIYNTNSITAIYYKSKIENILKIT